ncbi:type I DNA topoisomerase [Christensenella tenuis]|uniref:DNA topoisomerase 1 n=1 Tax=Christensenella tenuis TaxID=2763033 RepID=A0ABR7EBI8_9FIRM|nr:type I DNA topoisomerase [Christensenella tenuis]MBC5647127.1 type I DNA topoisomerase [Christensenella tenuis]
MAKEAAGAAKKTAVKKKTAKKNTGKTKTSNQKLVIVESPAKAKTIEKFLGRGYAVRASNGHLRDLPKSKIGVDVENNFEPEYTTIRGKAPLIKTLKDEAKKSSKVYLATDPDREGEAISWHIANILGLDPGEVSRIEFNEITKDAVTNAITHPRSIDMDRVDAQQARRVLDRLVGYKLSPLLWKKVKKGLSAGRVQSVAVKVIVDRENEIRNFKPEEFWTISAKLKKEQQEFEAKYYGPGSKKAKLDTEADAQAVLDAVKDADFIVSKVKSGTRKKNALPPFTTSFLQQSASGKLGFTAKKTMMLAQMLYEGVPLKDGNTVGLITYMRTDSTRISGEAQEAALAHIKKTYGDEYAPAKPNIYKGRKNAQDAHEAIRPTYIENTPESVRQYLTNDQFKLYKLIYTRFLASQMMPAQFETLSYDIDANGQTFKASGSRILFKGHLAVYDSKTEDDDQKMLPKAEQGETLECLGVTPKQNFTQPPARYTEAALIKFLEERGIGRPSTYAPIISTIQDRGYVQKEAKSFVPTELGEIVTDLMAKNFSDIVDIAFTADMEEKLDGVEQEGNDWKKVIGDFYGPFEKDLEAGEKNIERIKLPEKVSDVICEKCGANMVYKTGRFGEFLACPNYPECKNTKPIVKQIDVPCPKCGGKVVIKRAGKSGKSFYGCENYPNCDFVSWDKPLDEKCPECGAYMVEAKFRYGGKTYKKCSNPECITNQKKKTDTDAKKES